MSSTTSVQPTYAAVVLYYRLGERIHATVAALLDQQVAPAAVVVVDNASGDGVLDRFEAQWESQAVRVIRLPVNVGYAAGMNAGAAHVGSGAEYVLFMTHEVILARDCVAELLSACAGDSSIGMVGPGLRLLPAGTGWSFGGRITRFGDVRHSLCSAQALHADWLDGACLLVRSQVFGATGGFDEDYFLYWEDVDFSLKVRRHNRIRCVPAAVAYQGTNTAPHYYRVRNRILCWRKNHRWIWVGYAVVSSIAKAMLVDMARRSPHQSKARLLGVADGLRHRLATSEPSMVRSP